MKFMKALRDNKTKYVDREITMKVFMNYPALGNIFFNKGVENYNKKNYDKSFDNFEKSLYCTSFKGTADTVAIYYAGLSAKKAGKYDKAIEYLKMAQKLNYGKTDKDKILVYKLLAETYKENKDTAKYISTLKKGIEKHPSASSLLIPDVINFYLAKKQNDEALNYLNKAIQQIDHITQTIASTSEESASAAEELNAQALKTGDIIKEIGLLVGYKIEEFKLDDKQKNTIKVHHKNKVQKPEDILPLNDEDMENFK
jgi:tetratricopeptide (TPR) repeat protein